MFFCHNTVSGYCAKIEEKPSYPGLSNAFKLCSLCQRCARSLQRKIMKVLQYGMWSQQRAGTFDLTISFGYFAINCVVMSGLERVMMPQSTT